MPDTDAAAVPRFKHLRAGTRLALPWAVTRCVSTTILLLITALAVSCQRVAPLRPLVVALPSGLSSSMPNTSTLAADASVLANVYEALVDVSGDLALRPGLGRSPGTLPTS